ncbi:MAG: hypothetical protein J0I65_18590 [Variovorax sp.]|nr:hypothetical protein [Variovorax sp.]
MPKAQKVRETTNALGAKINAVMAEKGMAGDYAALAREFGVATPSTYDWITHGRLGKERYQKLVEWSGRPLDWWFDIQPPAYGAAEQSTPLLAREAGAPVPIARGERWPFTAPLERVRALAPIDIAMIDGYIKGVIDTRQVDARKSL